MSRASPDEDYRITGFVEAGQHREEGTAAQGSDEVEFDRCDRERFSLAFGDGLFEQVARFPSWDQIIVADCRLVEAAHGNHARRISYGRCIHDKDTGEPAEPYHVILRL